MKAFTEVQKVKYKKRWFDVLDRKEYYGSTFYAIEKKTGRIEWLKDTDVEGFKRR